VSEPSELSTRRAEHATILQACIDHNPELAGASLHNHLIRTANLVAEAMGGTPLFSPLSAGSDGR
jgi:DNA-binding GntR family transcriptional regulator